MRASFCLLLVGAVACASAAPQTRTSSTPDRDTTQGAGLGGTSTPNADPFPSTYAPFPSRTTLIRNVNILTAAGPMIRNGAILLQNGKIAAVGATVTAPADALVIDGTGKYVTPGIIDDHSHLGVYAAPGGQALSDGNEATSPTTPYVWAEHSVWPQDPQFPRNLAGGVTTLQVLPGSASRSCPGVPCSQ
jgi:imidazolonepropionase-like amidohydrolase